MCRHTYNIHMYMRKKHAGFLLLFSSSHKNPNWNFNTSIADKVDFRKLYLLWFCVSILLCFYDCFEHLFFFFSCFFFSRGKIIFLMCWKLQMLNISQIAFSIFNISLWIPYTMERKATFQWCQQLRDKFGLNFKLFIRFVFFHNYLNNTLVHFISSHSVINN